MSDKYERYTEALNALVAEAVSCTPETWRRGVLAIDCDGVKINYTLKNEESSEPATISADLAKLCERYWVAFRDNGEPWLESTIEFYQHGESWKFAADYKYPERPKKPFWRFGR